MKTNYISKELLIDRIYKQSCRACKTPTKCRVCPVENIIRLIKQQVTVDVAPVVHGEWEYIGTDTDKMEHVFRCSNCANRIGLDKETDYCPNCGAKMDLEEKNEVRVFYRI